MSSAHQAPIQPSAAETETDLTEPSPPYAAGPPTHENLILDLLGSDVLADVREALRDADDVKAAEMLDESLAAMCVLALDRPARRSASLALLVPTTRRDLEARGVIDCLAEPRVRWTVTSYGEQVLARILAAAPTLDQVGGESVTDILTEIDDILANDD